MTRTYVALDLETTGLDPEQDRIIEIGAVRFDASGRELEAYQQLINPGREIPPFIERFTGQSLNCQNSDEQFYQIQVQK